MFLHTLNIPASGLTAQQYRLNIVAQNITNAETTRTEEMNEDGTYEPYRRKTVVFTPINEDRRTFKSYLHNSLDNKLFQRSRFIKDTSQSGGVRVTQVIEDPSPFKIVYDPEHPDADADGYVEMPNVEMVQEMVDMMSASRSYEANVQVINSIKAMAQRALEIGR